MVENIIELKNLCKSYDELTILDNFSLNIKKNEFLTLLGPSGCGKTTTLKIIAGFENADNGEVLFEGKDMNNHVRINDLMCNSTNRIKLICIKNKIIYVYQLRC